MRDATQPCSICGEEKLPGQSWFLIAESDWEDKLKILTWHEQLAAHSQVHAVCCGAHAQELVVHWMTTGSLAYPFARTSPGAPPPETLPGLARLVRHQFEADTSCTRQVGELAVHRESLDRALTDNPDALQVILDELSYALEQETGSAMDFTSRKIGSTTIRQV